MTRAELQNLVINYAEGYGIDPAIALAQIERESGFNPNAVGADGERGLAQILPSTWPQISQGISFDQAFDPDYNLTAWGNYMQWLLDRYGWDYSKALMAYNGGPGNLDRGTVSQAAQSYAKTILANAGQQIVSYDTSDTLPTREDSGLSIWAIGGIALAVLLIVFSRK